jgi:hypothetical protein
VRNLERIEVVAVSSEDVSAVKAILKDPLDEIHG